MKHLFYIMHSNCWVEASMLGCLDLKDLQHRQFLKQTLISCYDQIKLKRWHCTLSLRGNQFVMYNMPNLQLNWVSSYELIKSNLSNCTPSLTGKLRLEKNTALVTESRSSEYIISWCTFKLLCGGIYVWLHSLEWQVEWANSAAKFGQELWANQIETLTLHSVLERELDCHNQIARRS